MGKIQKYESGAVQIKKELPSNEIFRMDYLEGWEDMSEPQKAYLCVFFDTYPKKIKACVDSGISQSSYTKWINNDRTFNELMKLIEQIHREELEYLEYVESYTDSKVRGRFLKKGGSSNNRPNQTIVINNSKESSSFGKIDDIVDDIEVD